MKILNIMLGSGRGGLEQAAVDHAAMLTAQGHEVTNIGAPTGWFRRTLPRDGSFTALSSWGSWDFPATLKLERIARRTAAQAAICHGRRAMTHGAGMPRSVVRIGMCHNIVRDRNLAAMDGFISVADWLACDTRARGVSAARVHIVPNMMRLVPPESRRRIRPAVPVVGAFGRLHKIKGFDVLLDAAGILARRNLTLDLVIGGDGPERARLEAHAEKVGLAGRVSFPGWVGDKADFFNGIDVFCLPSRHEPFGISLIEAMASEVPVVASAACGPSEIITDGTDGLLTAPGDASALAWTLAALLDSPDRMSAIGRAARASAMTHYTPDVIAPRLSQVVEEIVRVTEQERTAPVQA